jgi:rSAM/selenodomain-associated transferase 1
MRPTRHLVVMVREPRLGRVKRRLAADIGAVAAWRFYRETAGGLLRRLRDRRWRCWLAVTPDRRPLLPPAWRRGWTAVAQGPGGLGARMLSPVRRLPPGPVVVIGSDIPGVRPRHIAAAFDALGDHDAVIGPAADGGFWLVGFRRSPRLPRDPFRAARWSTPHALADVMANLDGMRVARLDTLADVDDGAAYRRAAAGGSRPGAP